MRKSRRPDSTRFALGRAAARNGNPTSPSQACRAAGCPKRRISGVLASVPQPPAGRALMTGRARTDLQALARRDHTLDAHLWGGEHRERPWMA